MSSFPLARVARGAALYPARLERISRPPADLWLRGGGPGAGPAVAVVGARAASGAAREKARALAAELAGTGIAIISGGAFGVDAAAHEGALGAGGETFAVLGCGTDVVYPDRHGDLFDRIARAGGVLSEYPPGTQPRPGQFPARNRIIAGLSDLVVVVEAGFRSGALSTARWARDCGIPVCAFAGSAGTDRLIGRGAIEVTGAGDVRDVLAGRQPPGRAPRLAVGQAWASSDQDDHSGLDLGDPERGARLARARALLDALGTAALRADTLAVKLGRPVVEVMAVLGEAETEGWIRRVPGGAYEVTRGH